jgi:hypothetical protein
MPDPVLHCTGVLQLLIRRCAHTGELLVLRATNVSETLSFVLYPQMLAKTLSQAEAQLYDANIDKLGECKHLSEQEVVELASKCKVRKATMHLDSTTIGSLQGTCEICTGMLTSPIMPRRSCCSKSRTSHMSRHQ